MKQKELKAAFNAADKIGAGLLDSTRLNQALRALGLKTTMEDMPRLIASVERQDDGYVDFSDFKAIALELARSATAQPEAEPDDQCSLAFQLLADTQSAGITRQSLQRACESQGSEWTMQDVLEMMNEGDMNHDGVIDPVEFQRIWKLAGF